jgi:hypothetical protein
MGVRTAQTALSSIGEITLGSGAGGAATTSQKIAETPKLGSSAHPI